VLIAGCGYVGSALAESLAAAGHSVWGLRRRFAGALPGVTPIEADLGLPSTLGDLPPALDAVFYLASPAGGDDAHYRIAYVVGLGNLLEALEKQRQAPRRVFFVSSTGVYGQQHGEWVDEKSPTAPRHFSGRRLLEGEARLRAAPFAATVVRLGGIYGPRRTRLIEQVRTGAARYRAHPPHYGNRIHRDDCVGVLRHLMALPAPAELYLGVDCEPAEERVVMTWLAGVLGAPAPRPAAPGEIDPRRGNKRCRNRRLLDTGYTFRYPDFRAGYTALLSELRP
jgi:nucleoside-diphosphate-sugar epimerase